ncbi:propionyl-CoA carboxylase beta chain [Arthrobacter sp. Hiyo4]|nr:propionyl-CoA carboxylase beta chain [Arthrobacter sp. Hiyo4]
MAHGADRRDGCPRRRQHPVPPRPGRSCRGRRDVEARRAEVIRQYEEELLNPYQAAQLGYVDAVIAPSDTRGHIIKGLRALRDKRASLPTKKHGNIPL